MRQWRIGTITTGILLILLGVLLLLKTFTNIDIKDILFYGWPVILILLGLEILIFSLVKNKEGLKFSFFSIFIIFLAFSLTFLVYAIDEVGLFSEIERVIDGENYTVDVETTLSLPDTVTEMSIDATNGYFKIIGKETDSINITGTMTLFSEKDEASEDLEEIYSVKIIGNKLVININDSHKNLWFGNSPKANLNIVIPNDLLLKIDIVNGNIEMDNMLASGNIENVNGDIVINNSNGEFDTKTVNGKISITNNIGGITAETTNGQISIAEIDGDLNLKTTNGDIQVNTSTISDDWKISTLNGKLTLDIPSDVDVKISADSEVSDVAGNIQWINLNNDESYVGSKKEVTLGSGEHSIDLKTLSGKIEVNTR
ncbi:MAG: DUF4097 domain-containing protein [Vulcanibacillus sp.]